jgi:hypothetical protein
LNKTLRRNTNNTPDERQVMPMDMFIDYIGTGRHTANKIAEQAEAKIYIGRRVLINMSKVSQYLETISE